MKKFLAFIGTALCSVVSFAEGEAVNNWDFSTVGTEVTNMGNAYKSFVTTYMMPAAVIIISAGVILYIITRAPRSAGLGKK